MLKIRADERLSIGGIVVVVLVFLGLDAVFAIVSVVIFVAPAPVKDLAAWTGVLMVLNAIWLGAGLAWDRMRRRRRRERLGG